MILEAAVQLLLCLPRILKELGVIQASESSRLTESTGLDADQSVLYCRND